MKRRLIAMLLVLAIMLGQCAAYAESDWDWGELLPGDATQDREDSEQTKEESTLEGVDESNKEMLEILGKKDWTALAEAARKTGDWREDLVAVAESQRGYAEDEDGMTIYTSFAGDKEPREAWTAQFISWVAAQAGLTEKQFPRENTHDAFVSRMSRLSAVKRISRADYPLPGDIALLEVDGQKLLGVVTYISNDMANVIFSNNDAVVTDVIKVGEKEFNRFVDLNELMERAGIEVGKGGEVPAIPAGGIAAWTNTDAVYMRKEPTTASKRVTTVKKAGTALVVTAGELQEDDYIWYAVKYGKYTGYIRGDLLRLDLGALPTATPVPTATPAPTATPVPAVTPAPVPTVVPGCALCAAEAAGFVLPADCLYEALCDMSAEEACSFMAALLEDDYLTFMLYVNCHNAHVLHGAEAVICGEGCEQSIYNPVKPGAAHSTNCPWFVGLTAEERVVNIVLHQPVNADGTMPGENATFTYEVYGAQKYQWFQVKTERVFTGRVSEMKEITRMLVGENGTTLTVEATKENDGASYFCEATLADGTVVASKMATLNVQETILAKAILGEDVYFTYTFDGAYSYQWYMKKENALGLQTSGSINGFNPISGATEAKLSLIADMKQSGVLFFAMALDANGNELGRSSCFKYEIPVYERYDVYFCTGHDLCKYVAELANMTRAERFAIMSNVWTVECTLADGTVTTLAEAVRMHWQNKHTAEYPSLLCTCLTLADPAEGTHGSGCPWGNAAASQNEREYEDPCQTRYLGKLPAEVLCAYEFLKMMNPLEQYSYLLALYAESAVAYNDFYTAYWYHTTMQYGSMPELLCGCRLLDMADANMAPGLNHQTTCAWYMTEAEQALAERTSNDPEFAEWAETASEEMIQRALSVKTLDHAVFEANENGVGYTLYIARYEEPVGSVDANGYLTYGNPAVVIAWVDFTTGMVYFVNDLPENAPPVPAN